MRNTWLLLVLVTAATSCGSSRIARLEEALATKLEADIRAIDLESQERCARARQLSEARFDDGRAFFTSHYNRSLNKCFVALYQVGRELGIRGDLWWGKSILVIAAAYVVFESGWAPLMITAPAALAVGAVLTWLLRVFDVDDIATVRRLLGRPSGAA